MSSPTTPVSLLERLVEAPEPANWGRFVDLYTPLLCAWTTRLRLDDHDAADLVQDVLTTLVVAMPRFRYDTDGSFRAWLKTILLNRWRELLRKRQARTMGDATLLGDLPADSDPLANLEEREYQRYLVQRAMTILQSDFQAETWQAFWKFVVEDLPAQDVAQALGLTVNAVYLARGRVLRRLREELRGLLD